MVYKIVHNYVILFFLFFGIGPKNICLAQSATPSQIERSQELLEKDKALRGRLEKEKVFIKKIIVAGVTLLDKDQIKEIVLPFENRWLFKDEIQQILDLITAAFRQKGYPNQPKNISFQIKKGCLKIKVVELSH